MAGYPVSESATLSGPSDALAEARQTSARAEADLKSRAGSHGRSPGGGWRRSERLVKQRRWVFDKVNRRAELSMECRECFPS